MEVGGWTMYFKKRGLRICVYMKWTDKVLGGRFGLLIMKGTGQGPLYCIGEGSFRGVVCCMCHIQYVESIYTSCLALTLLCRLGGEGGGCDGGDWRWDILRGTGEN